MNQERIKERIKQCDVDIAALEAEKKKLEKQRKKRWEDLPVGTVYETDSGITCLIVRQANSFKKDLLLLNYSSGSIWLEMGDGVKEQYVGEILGTFTGVKYES